jgi:hypothetical protein
MFQNASKSISLDEIEQIESELNVKMPQSLKQHYIEFNGGTPDQRCWLQGDGYERLCIHRFLPMKYPAGELTIESVYKRGIEKDFLSPDLLPFAIDEGSNFFCVDSDGVVYFYAMDSWSAKRTNNENKAKARRQLVSSFEMFLAGLVDEPEEV